MHRKFIGTYKHKTVFTFLKEKLLSEILMILMKIIKALDFLYDKLGIHLSSFEILMRYETSIECFKIVFVYRKYKTLKHFSIFFLGKHIIYITEMRCTAVC